MSPFTHLDERALVEVDEDACFDLLRADTFGRVIFTHRAMPAVVPVNYVVEGRDILLRTDPGSMLGRSIDGSVVAFEVDALDRSTRTGWTVVVVGTARAQVSPDGPGAPAEGPVPWAPGDRSLLIRIASGHVSGRRLVVPA